MMDEEEYGWQVRHGDVAGAVAVIREILDADEGSLNRLGARAQGVIEGRRTRRISCGRVCDAIAADGSRTSVREELGATAAT
jgi:transcription elongation GreA/GreB family factor